MNYETKMGRHKDGWKAETMIPLGSKGESGERILTIETYKQISARGLISRANVSEHADGMMVHAFGLGTGSGDYSKRLIVDTSARCTEKAVITQHHKALEQVEAVLARAKAHYANKLTTDMLLELRKFIGPSQMHAIQTAMRGEEGQWFREKLAEIHRIVTTMPKTYQTDGEGDKAIAHLRYFAGGQATWHITERDKEAVQHQAFGHADLFGDGGELGYISIVEILQNGGELDLHYTPKPLAEALGKTKARELTNEEAEEEVKALGFESLAQYEALST